MLQQGDVSAVQEAKVWQQNAASWADSLLQQQPLYKDMLQPLALAIYEVRYGLCLMTQSATRRVGQEGLDSALTDCLSFPSTLGQGEASFQSFVSS